MPDTHLKLAPLRILGFHSKPITVPLASFFAMHVVETGPLGMVEPGHEYLQTDPLAKFIV